MHATESNLRDIVESAPPKSGISLSQDADRNALQVQVLELRHLEMANDQTNHRRRMETLFSMTPAELFDLAKTNQTKVRDFMQSILRTAPRLSPSEIPPLDSHENICLVPTELSWQVSSLHQASQDHENAQEHLQQARGALLTSNTLKDAPSVAQSAAVSNAVHATLMPNQQPPLPPGVFGNPTNPPMMQFFDRPARQRPNSGGREQSGSSIDSPRPTK